MIQDMNNLVMRILYSMWELGSESPEEEEEEEENDNEEQRISHFYASQAFQVCIDWLHQQSEGEPNQILQVRRLQCIAHLKYSNSLKQTHITDFSK